MAELSATSVLPIDPTQATSASARTPEQVRALAAQFESLLLAQMLRDLRQSMFEDDEDSATGFGGGPLGDVIFSELTMALSRAGGVGLGQSLAKPLMQQANLDTPAIPDFAAGEPNVAAFSSVAPMTAALTPEVSVALPGQISSAYGWRRDPTTGGVKFHKGVDLSMPVGQELPAARAGQVTFSGELEGYGRTVVVKHDDRMSTRYAHLSEILVNVGDAVSAGQTIARSGASGRVTGPHLHFEVLENGKAVDPAGVWPPLRTR